MTAVYQKVLLVLSRLLVASLCLLSLASYASDGQNTEPLGGVPIVFESATSQMSGQVTMIGRLPGATVAFEAGRFRMGLREGPSQLDIGFKGASPAVPRGTSILSSQSNYLLGNDPTQWRTHIPNYRRVEYAGLYPGIDGVFYGSGQSLEHDFLVAPGADYRQIRLHLSQRSRAILLNSGDLTITLAGGALQMHKPVIYQDLPSGRQQRQGAFHVFADGDIGFTVGSYDHKYPLVIDPVLSFATYLASQPNETNFIATDSNGNNYVAGYTTLGFPQTAGGFPGCGTCTAGEIVTYVAKLSADGKTLVYSTLLGGNGYTQPYGIGVDANGNALVAGRTQATDFPTKNGQTTGTAGVAVELGFLASLSPDGSALNYGTVLGGASSPGQSVNSTVSALAVDAAGNAYITGDTNSSLYPYTPGALNNGPPTYQNSQVYLSKFSAAGALTYSAFLGDPDIQGSTEPNGPPAVTAIAVDTAGNAYVAGKAGTLWPTTSGVYLAQNPGTQTFVARVAADGGSFVYSTLLPNAYINGMAAMPSGDLWIAGTGASSTYPTTASAYQPASTAIYNSVLTELNATGSDLVYSTFFGGSTYNVRAIALDPNGDLWLAGNTQDYQFPLVMPLQSVLPLGVPFVTPTASTLSQFDPTGTTLKFSTFLGGTAFGGATSLAVDANHRAHVSGGAAFGLYATSGTYRQTVPMPGASFSTETYPYVALVDPAAESPAVCVDRNQGVDWNPTTVGTFADRPLTVTNCGTLPLTISGVSVAAAVFTVPPSTNGCTQSLPMGQSCTLSVRYTPTAAEIDKSTLTIQSNASVTETVLPMYATGVVPKIQVYSLPLFDYTLVGQTSAPALLFLQNAGGSPLILNAAGTHVSGDFSLQGLGNCARPIAGSCTLPIYFKPTAPGTRTGILQIASNDPASPTIAVNLQATGYAGAPIPEITSVGTQLLPAGVAEADFPVQGFGFLPTSVVQVNGVPQRTTYVSETLLKATLAASSIPANSYGELTLTVFTPAPGGGLSAPIKLTEYQSILTPNSFLLYEPVSKQLYASIPAASTSNPNTVLPIDPVTAAVGAPISVGNDPGVLAASSDGAYLYVALNGDHSIQRINLSTRAIERTFALPVDPTFGGLQVFDLHVVPGNSTEVAVSLQAPGVSPGANGVAFFNDAGLVNWIGRSGSNPGSNSTSADIYRFVFTDPGTLWAGSAYEANLNQLTVSPAGIAITSTTCCSLGINLATDGTLIYTEFGLVWNPATGQLVRKYAVGGVGNPNSVIPDAGSGKTYFLNSFSSTDILAFDQASSAQKAALSSNSFESFVVPTATQLVRWGSNGFAMRGLDSPAGSTGGAILVFTSSTLTGGSNINPTPVAGTLAPSSAPAGDPDLALTVKGSGFVPGSTLYWNDSPRLTTVVSPTQLTATVYASDIATMGTSQVTVASPGNGGGFSNALPFTISAALPPPTPALPVLSISPASLTFTAQEVSTASTAQMISLTNSGTADLTGLHIAITGTDAASFAETTQCGATLSAGAACSLSVVFTPSAAGALSATVTITSNATASPQTVALAGSGTQSAFSFAPQTGGSATTTVAAGQPAAYALSLTPAAGYSGSVTLSCSGLPANASCVFSPATLQLAGGKATNFSLSIGTKAPQSSLIGAVGTGLAAVLLVLPLRWRKRRKQGARAVWIGLIALTVGVCGCGGGGGSSAPAPPVSPSSANVAPGTYAIQVVASDGTTTQKMPLTLVVK
jgi:Beta-propeller repeat/Abnormal spindle-like microcephaly-assoc'd, ASPM-SPD-2-Hydin